MEVQFDGQNAFTAAANGDFPLVVLLWGMAMAVQPKPADMLSATDAHGNSIMHHAAAVALEGNTSIVHFLVQQTQGAGRELSSVVDARNLEGETPLIRAAHVGNLRVLDALVQFGRADVTARDRQGNTAAHHAAAQGHLWALHYLLEAQRRQEPKLEVVSLGGRCESKRSVLHYACVGEHKVVVQYLLSRGFDPDAQDEEGASPRSIAKQRQVAWLVKLLEEKDRSFTVPPTKCRNTRLWLVMLYGALLFAVLSTSYWLPWWVAVPFIVIVLWRSLSKFRAPHGHGGHSHGAKDPESLHPSKRNMLVPGYVSLSKPAANGALKKPSSSAFPGNILKPQPEMIVGVWMGWVLTFTFFHVVVWVDSSYSFMVTDGTPFLAALWGLEVVFLLVWMRLAVLCPSDPGVINTFQTDVTEMLANAVNGIPPPQASHCRTCFIRKPIRSKHCAQCGVCVGRMDHHCGWINRCVGYGSHRLFMVFLIVHLVILFGYIALAGIVFQHFLKPGNLDATRGSSAMRVWMQIPSLVSEHFLAFLVLVWAGMAAVALAMMLSQHVGNMFKNLTINEQINWKRYPYLKQAPGKKPGKLQNEFDRGLVVNTAEFWRRSGPSAVDYRKVFTIGVAGQVNPTEAQPLNAEDVV